MRHILPHSAILLLPLALPAAVPLGWKADAARPSPYVAQVFRGETVELSASLTAYSRPLPVASATLCVVTNGMDEALCWQYPATAASNVVTATWAPSMDCGADEYTFFFRAVDGDGVNYRANGVIRMLPSPGFAPNELPSPIRHLDFAVVAWTNAPWLTVESDPTVPAWAKAENPPTPSVDLDGYATTGAVAIAVAAMHPEFQEWASPTYDRIVAEAVPASSSQTNRGDAVATIGRTSGYALRAVRSTRSSAGMDTETDIEGSWALVGSTDAATLTSNVLHSTSTPGDATVEFSPALLGAETMRAAVSMPGDAVRTETVWPAAESTAWRSSAVGTHFIPDVPDQYTVATSRWNNATYICTNWVDGMGIPPYWYAAPAVNSGGGLVGIAPHYALSSTHCGEYGPKSWCTGASSGRGVSIATFGDLRLLRMPVEIPAMCRAKLLRASVLATRSDSLLFRALGNVHTQHGCILPCILEPRNYNRADLTGLDWDSGWTYVGVDREWRNATHTWLRPYSHAAHSGDSGHPVWFEISGLGDIPVGLFHWADGGGECLLSDALLDRIDAAIKRDSGGVESLSFYTLEDLQ